MSDPWSLSNSGTAEANMVLSQGVAGCRNIIDDLENTLASVPGAIQASGVPIWVEHKTAWNAQYYEMVKHLTGVSFSGAAAHDAYKRGDRQTARIMMG